MSEIGNNVYLILEIVRADKSGVAYNMFMRASKRFNQFIKGHQSIGASIRDSLLTRYVFPTCEGQQIQWRNQDGRFHRIDGPAWEHICVHGDDWNEWYYCGTLHRVGGPATTDRYKQQWIQNGYMHRDDGPALVYIDILAQPNEYFSGGVCYATRSAYYARHIPRRPPSQRIKNRQNPY